VRRETWVSPPVVAREATPAWVAVWRFRLLAIALLAVFVWVLYQVFQQYSGANSQDPGLDALGPLAALLL
jgi:hypothetical protein